jgi:hypothetical protein
MSRLLQFRKCALHLILAGHRYGKAAQRVHAIRYAIIFSIICSTHFIRCYRLALATYRQTKTAWTDAIDHINYTLSHHLCTLRQPQLAIQLFMSDLFTHKSVHQSAQQHSVFVTEFATTIKVCLCCHSLFYSF